MSDDMNMTGEEPMAPEGTVAPLPAPPMIKPGMARRNVLLIVALVIVLVVLAGFVAYAIITAGSAAVTGGGVPVTGTPGTGTTPPPTTTPTATLLPVPDVEFRDVFTPRDPFKPLKPIALKKVKAAATSADASSDGTSAAVAQSLSLVSIDSSATTAVVKLGSTNYTVHAGSTVGSPAWQITAIFATYIDVTDPEGIALTYYLSN